MDPLTAFRELTHDYPFLYDCFVIVLALGVCAIADLVVHKILLRGLKQIFSHLFEGDEVGEKLILKISARLANAVPSVIL